MPMTIFVLQSGLPGVDAQSCCFALNPAIPAYIRSISFGMLTTKDQAAPSVENSKGFEGYNNKKQQHIFYFQPSLV